MVPFLVDSDKLDDATLAAIAEVSKSAEGSLRVKLHNKNDALDKIARHLGMYDHDAKQATPINIVVSQSEREGRL